MPHFDFFVILSHHCYQTFFYVITEAKCGMSLENPWTGESLFLTQLCAIDVDAIFIKVVAKRCFFLP
jgi:hypothetical protein